MKEIILVSGSGARLHSPDLLSDFYIDACRNQRYSDYFNAAQFCEFSENFWDGQRLVFTYRTRNGRHCTDLRRHSFFKKLVGLMNLYEAVLSEALSEISFCSLAVKMGFPCQYHREI